jgi:hypothetical protein
MELGWSHSIRVKTMRKGKESRIMQGNGTFLALQVPETEQTNSNLMPAKEIARCVGWQFLTGGALQTEVHGQQILYDLQSSCVAFLQSYKLAFFILILCGIHFEVHL